MQAPDQGSWAGMLDAAFEKVVDNADGHAREFAEQFQAIVGRHSSDAGNKQVTVSQKWVWGVADALSGVDSRILMLGAVAKMMAARLDQLEAAPALNYRGVFADGQGYVRGDMTTWAGSLWHCNESTYDKPGEGSRAWTLAVKKGRDGKDAERRP